MAECSLFYFLMPQFTATLDDKNDLLRSFYHISQGLKIKKFDKRTYLEKINVLFILKKVFDVNVDIPYVILVIYYMQYYTYIHIETTRLFSSVSNLWWCRPENCFCLALKRIISHFSLTMYYKLYLLSKATEASK